MLQYFMFSIQKHVQIKVKTFLLQQIPSPSVLASWSGAEAHLPAAGSLQHRARAEVHQETHRQPDFHHDQGKVYFVRLFNNLLMQVICLLKQRFVFATQLFQVKLNLQLEVFILAKTRLNQLIFDFMFFFNCAKTPEFI